MPVTSVISGILLSEADGRLIKSLTIASSVKPDLAFNLPALSERPSVCPSICMLPGFSSVRAAVESAAVLRGRPRLRVSDEAIFVDFWGAASSAVEVVGTLDLSYVNSVVGSSSDVAVSDTDSLASPSPTFSMPPAFSPLTSPLSAIAVTTPEFLRGRPRFR